MECDGFQKFFTQFSFSLGFGAVMTFSHMDTGELINLGRPPPLRSPNRGSPAGTVCVVAPSHNTLCSSLTYFGGIVTAEQTGLITKYVNHLEEIKRRLTHPGGNSRRFALLPHSSAGI